MSDPLISDSPVSEPLAPDPLASDPLAQVILDLCAAVGPQKSIDPTEAAKFFAQGNGEDELAWRHHLHKVRRSAVALAVEGRLVILRKGKPVDPKDFRGVYRLSLPRGD
jgi:hypothetical protein